MGKLIFTLSLFVAFNCIGQDSLVTYSKAFEVDIINVSEKDKILDKAIVWCSKYLSNGKNFITTDERSNGIIGGYALLFVPYKYPVKRKIYADSYLFNDYQFHWYIEVKQNTFTFWISKITLKQNNNTHLVTYSTNPPINIKTDCKTNTEGLWALSKSALMARINMVAESLTTAVLPRKNGFIQQTLVAKN